MTADPVIRGSAFCLVHAPDLVRYGSKPRRELDADPSLLPRLCSSLRTYEAAVRYPPNQTFIGNLTPESLSALSRPWHEGVSGGARRGARRGAGTGAATNAPATGPFGEIVSQPVFYALLQQANVLQPPLVVLQPDAAARLRDQLASHPILGRLAGSPPADAGVDIAAEVDAGLALALETGERLEGCVRGDRRAEGLGDANLDPYTLLEALCSKASGALALTRLLHQENLAPADIDYLISCGEEAAGDRYQRGGGGMAKAIGEMCGCINASGMDVKNFCAGPASALVTAGALIKAGLYDRVAVVAGGSLAKLGMKSMAFLSEGLPILDDCLGCMAILVTRDDGSSPYLRLERGAIGQARIGASNSDQAVYRQLILDPLEALGLTLTDIDRFAPELHNPEIMEHAGSGDVTHKNYRMIAATAVLAGAIDKAGMEDFVRRIGMSGYAPTQGHIPSGVPYLGHALAAMSRGEMRRVMFLCKASLFLNRLTPLYDGVSFIVEARSPGGGVATAERPARPGVPGRP